MKLNKYIKLTVLSGVLAVSLTSCASMINGPTQQVPIVSDPAGAEIEINGINYGKTPTVVTLSRGEPHVIRINKPGYASKSVTLTNRVSGAMAGNLLVGGIIGMAADASNGSMYKLTPSRVNVSLNPTMERSPEPYYPVPGRIRNYQR